MDNNYLAELLFPDIKEDISQYEEKYPLRVLPEGAAVTRFAPSPTGFVHLGSLFASLISMKIAKQTKGVCYLRIEDTDKKREIEDGIYKIVSVLSKFGILFDEGFDANANEIGNYGPYVQSKRERIYKAYVKSLVQKGLAYPCFCSAQDLESTKEKQSQIGAQTGYYGEWASCRNLSMQDIEALISEKKDYVIRLRSSGNTERTVTFDDQIRGKLQMPENDQDIVLLKSDGIPTYHFAHVVDDHLMRTTHVIRGEEWLPSVSLHIQLFKLMGFKVPKYAHITTINKMDGNSRRKLSKRKDPELSIDFYEEAGYPAEAVKEYLINLANSAFEDWRKQNPTLAIMEYKLKLNNMSVSGPLFDIMKFEDICKNVISVMSTNDVLAAYHEWAKTFNVKIADMIDTDSDYFLKIFAIDRGGKKPRKDIAKWSEVEEYFSYFFDDHFARDISNGFTFNNDENNGSEIAKLLSEYINMYSDSDTQDEWFEKIRTLSLTNGYAVDMKEYRNNPDAFKGSVADVSGYIRIAVTNRGNTPNLHAIMQILGKEKVISRINQAVKCLK